jgi:hypothetical protein
MLGANMERLIDCIWFWWTLNKKFFSAALGVLF